MSTHSHTTVTVDGVSSPVLQAGPEDASEAVVFVHGNPGSGHDWSDLVEQTGQFARAVAPDMPGYAAADKPRDFNYTVEGYSAHLAGVLDELGITRAHLVLHDFGGPWGLNWAVSNPNAFASVTLINTGVLIDYKWHKFARIWRTPIVGEIFMATTSKALFTRLIGHENPKLSRPQVERIYELAVDRATKRAVLKLYRATPAAAMAKLAPALAALDRPALVVWGTDDRYIPKHQALKQLQPFPSARVELLEGHGHWAFQEAPKRVAELVIPFLKEQTGATQANAQPVR